MNPEYSLEAARARDAADPATARRREFHFPRKADGARSSTSAAIRSACSRGAPPRT